MGRTGGFDFYENTLIQNQQTGTAAAATGYTVNGAVTANGSSSVVVATGSTTFKKGDIITFSGCKPRPPETERIPAPAAVRGDCGLRWRCWHHQRVSRHLHVHRAPERLLPAFANGATCWNAPAPSTSLPAFPKDAFAFAAIKSPTAWTSRPAVVMDGISIARVVPASTTSTTTNSLAVSMCCAGYKTIRPQLKRRIPVQLNEASTKKARPKRLAFLMEQAMNEYPKMLFLDDECAIAEDKAKEDALRAGRLPQTLLRSDEQPNVRCSTTKATQPSTKQEHPDLYRSAECGLRWIQRTDLTDVIPDFIELAGARFRVFWRFAQAKARCRCL